MEDVEEVVDKGGEMGEVAATGVEATDTGCCSCCCKGGNDMGKVAAAAAAANAATKEL